MRAVANWSRRLVVLCWVARSRSVECSWKLRKPPGRSCKAATTRPSVSPPSWKTERYQTQLNTVFVSLVAGGGARVVFFCTLPGKSKKGGIPNYTYLYMYIRKTIFYEKGMLPRGVRRKIVLPGRNGCGGGVRSQCGEGETRPHGVSLSWRTDRQVVLTIREALVRSATGQMRRYSSSGTCKRRVHVSTAVDGGLSSCLVRFRMTL